MDVFLSAGPSLSWDALKFCLEAAVRNGWAPEGAHRPEYYSEIEARRFLSSGWTVTETDARGLVAALDCAISVLAEVADRARQGGFGISTKDDSTLRWLAARKEAALKIDPSTAKVICVRGQGLDPYGVENLSEEYRGYICKHWFARAPDSDVWVSFDDLPEETRKALPEIVTDDCDDLPF